MHVIWRFEELEQLTSLERSALLAVLEDYLFEPDLYEYERASIRASIANIKASLRIETTSSQLALAL